MRALLRRSRLSIAFAFAAIASVSACGSRTGLLVDETVTNNVADAAVDANQITDASTDSSTPAIACKDGTFALSLARAEVMFVIDRSGSMAFDIAGDPSNPTNPSRWTDLGQALNPVLHSIQDSVELGAKFFPGVNAQGPGNASEACTVDDTVDVEPALDTADAILDIFSTTQPSGGTPTAAAITAAATILSTSADTRAVSRFMVLATDGAPDCSPAGKDPKTCVCADPQPHACDGNSQNAADNCLDDVNTVAAITAAYSAQKIPTFVIGIGGTGQFTTVLDDMAVAGGRPQATEPRYYQVLVSQDLTDAFTQIQASITQCTFVTPSEAPNVNDVIITVNGAAIPYDATHTDGWDYVDKAFGEIEFFGAACTAAQASAATVSAEVSCDDGGFPDASVPDASPSSDASSD